MCYCEPLPEDFHDFPGWTLPAPSNQQESTSPNGHTSLAATALIRIFGGGLWNKKIKECNPHASNWRMPAAVRYARLDMKSHRRNGAKLLADAEGGDGNRSSVASAKAPRSTVPPWGRKGEARKSSASALEDKYRGKDSGSER